LQRPLSRPEEVVISVALASAGTFAACPLNPVNDKTHPAKPSKPPTKCVDLSAVPSISENIAAAEPKPKLKPAYSAETPAPYTGPTIGVASPGAKPAPTVGYKWSLE